MMSTDAAATTVAAVQMRAVPRDVAGNLDHARGFLDRASSRNAKLAVFPELFNVGYFIGPELFDLAETDDGRTVTWMREQAARRDMLVAGSIAESRGDRLLNTLFIAEPDGRLYRYSKKQLAKPEGAAFDSGDDLSIARTSLGRAGFAVCADLN